MNDVRYALRTLARNPGFAAMAVLTLALGIGANTAIFSVVHAVLLRPLPWPDADRLVSVDTTTADEDSGRHSAPDFEDLRREHASLAAVAGYRETMFTAAARPGEPQSLPGVYVTPDFFDVLGVPARHGRTFTRAIDAPRREPVVVLSHEAYRRLYGESPDAVGTRLRIDGEAHTLVGVLPAGAAWPAGTYVWVLSDGEVPPIPLEVEGEAERRESRYFAAIARIRPGVTFEQASRDMDRVARLLAGRRTATAQARSLRLSPIREEVVGDVRDGLLVFQAAVALVLLIACANVSSLLIARATGRQRELAIRAAIGAGRGRLVRQLLAESLVLSVVGGFAGLLLGAWLLVILVPLLPSNLPRAGEIELDRMVAAAAIAASLVTGILFGLMPALQASRTDASGALRQGGERAGAGRTTARAALVVAEVALTLTLLAGAGLLLNSFLRLQRVDSGMQLENVTVAPVLLPQTRYATPARQMQLYDRVIQGLSARSEIRAAGVGFPGPLRGDNMSGEFSIEGRDPEAPGGRAFANLGSVSGGYLEAMGIPLVDGRLFGDSDTADAPPVGIVSVELARRHWPGERVAGKRIRFGGTGQDDEPWRVIVGVVGDVRQLGLDRDPPPILYIPYQQFPLPFTTFAVRGAAPPSTIAALVRSEIAAADPELPPGQILTLEDVLNRSVAQPRFRTMLVGTFALMALALAAVGVFGLISYAVTQRTREIGIRMALGASPAQVLSPLIRRGLTLTGIGIGIGLAGAFLFARVLASFLYGVGPADPVTFAAVAGVLLVVTLLATYIPARRALRIDPIAALRTE